MNESQISVRYAKALFQSASEKQILDRVYKDMELLSDTCKLEDFQYMLVVPTLQESQKYTLVEKILKKHISDISLNMIGLVIKNRREVYLPGIARNFKDFYRREKGIKSVQLVTAVTVDDKAINSITELIRKTYDSEVELSYSVDKDVIGGFVLTVQDMRYNASVASNLKRMKKQLLQTSIENK